LPIFTRKEAVEIVLEAWRHHQRESALQILGFVVLENHLHLIARAPDLEIDAKRSFEDWRSQSGAWERDYNLTGSTRRITIV
jgi:REP element-mobilizing transposase RayT